MSASHFLENSSCRESLDKGLGLLRRALKVLETEDRPSQAGHMGMKMMMIGVGADEIGPEMIEIGRTCLRMFQITNNVKMSENCLILVTLLILKHFENVALEEVKLVFRENVKNIGDTVKHFMINVMKTLEDKDFVRLDALKESFDSLKTEEKITQPFIKQIIEDFSTPTTETVNDDNNNKDKDKSSEKPIKSKPHGKVSVGSTPAKNLALATGAAVVASAFTASTNTKIFKDAK